MGYVLQAVIGRTDQMPSHIAALDAARLATLRQGLSLLPITDEFYDSVTDGSPNTLGFRRLPGKFDHELAAWSMTGPIAYVEAEYFAGVGEQHAAVWADGKLTLGPLHLAEHEPFPTGGSPISQALRKLGTQRAAVDDEFTAVGLHKHRDHDGWLS
jgi:hypothetical protein